MGREGYDTKSKNLQIHLFIYFLYIYLFIYLFINYFVYIICKQFACIHLPCWLFCMLCFRGRAVANSGRTPLFKTYYVQRQ